MTISGGRTEQLYIFCRVLLSFTSDFLSFIVVELIWFFHGALQFLYTCPVREHYASVSLCFISVTELLFSLSVSVKSKLACYYLYVFNFSIYNQQNK